MTTALLRRLVKLESRSAHAPKTGVEEFSFLDATVEELHHHREVLRILDECGGIPKEEYEWCLDMLTLLQERRAALSSTAE